MERKQIILNAEELRYFPLFFRRIYYNEITKKEEEGKLLKYNSTLQCDEMCASFPSRQISKTINKKIFNPKFNNDE